MWLVAWRADSDRRRAAFAAYGHRSSRSGYSAESLLLGTFRRLDMEQLSIPDIDLVQLEPTATGQEVADACAALGRLYYALQLPVEAERLLETSMRLRNGLTSNGAGPACADLGARGCFYRRSGDLAAALDRLYAALLAKDPADALGSASVHLNLGATLSLMGQHQDALEQAHAALIVMQGDIFGSVTLPLQLQLTIGARMLREGLGLNEGVGGVMQPKEIVRRAKAKIASAEEKHYHELIMEATQLRKHDEVQRLKGLLHDAHLRNTAEAHSTRAVDEEVHALCEMLGLDVAAEVKKQQQSGQEQHQSDAHEDADHVDAKVSLLAIAYHNAGVAQESLGRHDHAVDSLVNAANLARTRLGWAN